MHEAQMWNGMARILQIHVSPLEVCAVGGLVRRGARSNALRVTKFPVCVL